MRAKPPHPHRVFMQQRHAESLRTLCRARLSRAGSLAGNRRTAVGERSLNETHAETVRGATP